MGKPGSCKKRLAGEVVEIYAAFPVSGIEYILIPQVEVTKVMRVAQKTVVTEKCAAGELEIAHTVRQPVLSREERGVKR